MFVYCVFYKQAYEVNELIGVFSDYEKARQFDLDYCAKEEMLADYEWTVIRKIELNKVYYGFGQIGEEV